MKDVQQFTRGLNNVAEAKIAGGDIQAALALYVRFRHELEQIGSPAYFRWLDVQEAAIAAAVGDWDRALELLRPALTTSRPAERMCSRETLEARADRFSTHAVRHGRESRTSSVDSKLREP